MTSLFVKQNSLNFKSVSLGLHKSSAGHEREKSACASPADTFHSLKADSGPLGLTPFRMTPTAECSHHMGGGLVYWPCFPTATSGFHGDFQTGLGCCTIPV